MDHDFEKELVVLLGRKASDLGVIPSKFGFVVKQGSFVKSWKRRWLVLCRLSLLYFESMESERALGGLSLAGLNGMNVQHGVLFLSCPVSYTVKKSGLVRLENRTLALKGLTVREIEEWFFAMNAAIKTLNPAHQIAVSAPPLPSRKAKQLTTAKRLRGAAIPPEHAQFQELLQSVETPASSRLIDNFVHKIRSANMDEHVIVREIAVLMSCSENSPLNMCLGRFAKKSLAKLESIVGKVVADDETNRALLQKFATKFKTFCEAMAAVIPVYLNEEPVFVEFYNLPEISVQVREILFSHFRLFEPIWDLYITVGGRRDSQVLLKCLDLSDVTLADLGVKSSKMWIGAENYKSALLTLKQITNATSVGVMSEVLVQTSVKVVECVTSVNKSYVQIGADEMLPVFSFLLIHSRLPHAVAQSLLLDHFTMPAECLGVQGYFVAQFFAAIGLIEAFERPAKEESSVNMNARLTLASRPKE